MRANCKQFGDSNCFLISKEIKVSNWKAILISLTKAIVLKRRKKRKRNKKRVKTNRCCKLAYFSFFELRLRQKPIRLPNCVYFISLLITFPFFCLFSGHWSFEKNGSVLFANKETEHARKDRKKRDKLQNKTSKIQGDKGTREKAEIERTWEREEKYCLQFG